MENVPDVDELLRRIFPDVDPPQGLGMFAQIADITTGLALGALYWPKFSIVRGAVFITFSDRGALALEARIAGQWDKLAASRAMTWDKFVDSYNRFEVRHLFLNWPEPARFLHESEDALARILVSTWSAKLEQDFPDRSFLVMVEDPIGEEGSCVLVTQTDPPLLPGANVDEAI